MVVEAGVDVIEAEARMAARVARVADGFARRYGYLLLGEWRRCHRIEYAGPPVPGMVPFGRPGVDEAWADESPGAGQVEPETKNSRLAAAWADLPRALGGVDARLDALEVRVARLVAVVEKVVEVQEVSR